MVSQLVSALALGLLGSGHCLVMCGPLALAGCSGSARHSRVSLYMLGRLTSYAFAGAVLGAGGASLARRTFFHQTTSVLLLLIAGAAVWRGLFLLRGGNSHRMAGQRSESQHARGDVLAGLWPNHPLSIGLLTGALPCGLLASAWTLAAASAHPIQGALIMLTFGLSSSPLLVTGLLLGRLGRFWRGAVRLHGVSWLVIGLWLILRLACGHAGGGCH